MAEDRTIDVDNDLKALEDDVLRKIGRNMMALQQIEALLKALLTQSNVRMGLAEVLVQQTKRNDAIAKQTLGMLVKQFTSEVLAPEDAAASDAVGECLAPYVTFSYSIQAEEAFVVQRTVALKLLVDERNELIHHFLPKWSRKSLKSGNEVSLQLDQQHARISVEFETLRGYLDGLQRSQGLANSVIDSPEFKKQFELLWLQNSQVVQLLVKLSQRAASACGWVPLDAAGQELWRVAQDDMESLHERYGYSKLKPLLVAARLFDLRNEPLANGRSRVLFRLREDAKERHVPV